MSTSRFLPRLSRVALLTLSLSGGAVFAAGESEWIYGVKPGDTLISIAHNYLTNPNDWTRLQKLNRIADAKRLPPGTKLRLPVDLLKREAAAAEVLELRGKATRTPSNGTAQALTRGEQLQTGDTVATAAESTMALRFVDGSRLLFTPNTSAKLTEMALLGKTGVAQTVTELLVGSVDTRVAPQPAGARYEIKSRALNLAVRGTDFRVAVGEADAVTRSEVLEGSVQAGAEGKPVLVPSGYGTLAAPGEAARAPVQLLAAPNLSTVAPLLESVPPRFQWAGAAGVENYRAQVFADKAMQQMLLDGTFKGSSAKWTDLPDGRYMLRVRGIDKDGLEGLNADREFVLKARPEPPFVSSPVDGGKTYGPEAKLRWSASQVAQIYHVQLSTRADFSTLVAEEKALVKNELTVPVEPGKYYWRVASIAAGQDHGPFGDVQGYTQRPIPASPGAEAPAMDDKTLGLRWRAGDAGASYQLQLAQDLGFSKPTVDKVLKENQVQLELPPPGTYFLRIKTLDADGFAGPYGAAQKIEVPGPWWWPLFNCVACAQR